MLSIKVSKAAFVSVQIFSSCHQDANSIAVSVISLYRNKGNMVNMLMFE